MRIFYASDVHGFEPLLQEVPERREVLLARRDPAGRRHHRQGDRAAGGDSAGARCTPRSSASDQVLRREEEVAAAGAADRRHRLLPAPLQPGRGGGAARRPRRAARAVRARDRRADGAVDGAGRRAARAAPAGCPASSTPATTTRRRSTRSSTPAERVEFLEGRVVELPDGIELASCGYANLTPWHCPRDVEEAELGAAAGGRRVAGRGPGVGDLQLPLPAVRHPDRPGPAARRGLAHALDRRRGRDASGRQHRLSRGDRALPAAARASTATCTSRAAPSSSGGRCASIPGSEYSEGVLRGAIVDVNEKKRKVKSTQFISG